MLSFAATPSSGTLTDVSGPLTYSAGPFNVANPTPVIQVDSGPECHFPNGTAQPCDDYALTANIPQAYLTANPNASIKVTMAWTDTGSGNSDYDLYVYKNPRSDCSPTDCTATDGTQAANYSSASGSNPEIAVITPLTAGLQKYTVVIVPYTPTREVVNVRIELQAGAPGGGGGGGGPFGGPDPTVAGNPRYQNYYAPRGSSAESSSGEFNIGVNRLTGHIFVMNLGPIWRLTPPEIAVPPFRPVALPECCEALWQDKSSNVTNTGLDPILWTDKVSGRTFASNTTTGTLGTVFTDSFTPALNDGDMWSPVAGMVNGGADHQTIGSGPYPTNPLYNFSNPTNQGQAVYYCSQDVVGPAACQRSDDLGVSFPAAVGGVPYDGNTPPGCGGLHGHLHVAANGTVWLPVNQCNGKQGGSVSTTATQPAVTAPTGWNQFVVQGNNDVNGGAAFTATSQTNGADPSIALDSDSTAYYCYVNNEAGGTEGHVHVAVGTADANGVTTWIRDVDVGASHGIKNAALTEAVGGSSGRAACGFAGTNVGGNYQSGTFPGVWYAFIATTYDQGRTWVTVNATPNDPVQRATGIWQQGGSGENGDRNLLDFNEITVDAQGRVLYGYSDGCVTPDCISGAAGNDYTAFMRVAHQSGGKPLYSQNDPNPAEPIAPKAPCLSGTRSPSESLLTWKAPDNGGSDITNYQIYRSNTSGAEVLIGQTGNASTTFRDINPPADPHLFYKVLAINSQGPGPLSNEIDLVAVVPPPVQTPCIMPGVTILTDPAGDTSAALGLVSTPAPPGSDLISFQLAQPYRSDGSEPRLVFTITTDQNMSQVEPAGWGAYVAMKINGDDPATPAVETTYYRGVRLSFTGATPNYEYYTPSPNNSGGVDGRFVKAGSNHPAESGTNWTDPSHTQITITIKASDLGLAVGGTISGFVSGTTQSSDPANLGAGATALYDQMPDSLSFAGSYTIVDNNTCAPLQSVVSRRTHGSAGTFDIALPTSGTTGAIEPRGGTHQLVYSFLSTVTAPGTVTVTPSGSGTTAIGSDNKSVVVTLSGIPNASHVVVTLNGVTTGGSTLSGLAAHMDVLLGDTTIDGTVNSADVSQTKSRSGTVVGSGNFRSDVTVDGSLNSADVSLVKSKSGTALPP